MSKLITALVSLTVGLAIGLTVPPLLAQPQETKVQKWEQFCEKAPFKSAQAKKSFARWKSYTNERGAEGYELIAPPVLTLGYHVFCFRRPVQVDE